MARVDTLVTKMKAQDAGALEAAKELAQLSQLGSHYKREILTKGAFDELWKYAKQGKFQWDDKWYEEVDLSKLTFDVKLGSGKCQTETRTNEHVSSLSSTDSRQVLLPRCIAAH